MQIAPVCFRIPVKNNNIVNNNTVANPLIKPRYNNELQKDTVSFGIKYNTVADSVWKAFSKDALTLKRIAVPFLDTVEAVAKQHMNDGVSFVREMFEANAVKGTDARLSKVLRAKTLEDRDAIRTTMFVKNPYDLSVLFDKIIPSFGPAGGRNYLVAPISTSVGNMMERGYVPFDEQNLIMQLLELPNTKEAYKKFLNGIKNIKYDYYGVKRHLYDIGDTRRILLEYLEKGKKPETKADVVELIKSLKKEVPDIDIRLDNKMLNISAIPEDRRLFVGKPHGNYEDIQIRFIRECDKAESNPIYHELLIQFGPNYNRNCRIEHERVYEPLRLFGELRVPRVDNFNSPNADTSSPEATLSKAINAIEEAFRRRVSDRLLLNGKNRDFYGDNVQKRVFFSESSMDSLEDLFKKMQKALETYYSNSRANNHNNNYRVQRQLKNDERADSAKLELIHQKLQETIQLINKEYQSSYGIKD